MDTQQLYDRFESLAGMAAALGYKSRGLVDDAYEEARAAMWEVLVNDPAVSDRDLYWRIVTKMRTLRRAALRRRERFMVGVNADGCPSDCDPAAEAELFDEIRAGAAHLPLAARRWCLFRAGYTNERPAGRSVRVRVPAA